VFLIVDPWGSHEMATQSVHWRTACSLATAVVALLVSRSLLSNGSIRHSILQWYQHRFPDKLKLYLIFCFPWSRDSVVGIAAGYGLDDRGVGVHAPVGSRIFFKSSRPALGSTQPPIQWIPCFLSPGLKRPGREAYHSPQPVPRSGKCGSIHPVFHTPSWYCA
jgi:hypothetical protein